MVIVLLSARMFRGSIVVRSWLAKQTIRLGMLTCMFLMVLISLVKVS